MSSWFSKNGLVLNNDKTQCVVFRTNHNKTDIPDYLQHLNSNIKISESCKILGVYIDSNLTWQGHIEKLCGRLSSVCYALRILVYYTNEDVVRMAYFGNFYSLMRYAVLCWGQSSFAVGVFRLQKRAIRIMYKMGVIDSCRGVFRKNGLLTLSAIFVYECILFVRRQSHYFKDYIPRHRYNRRFPQNFDLPAHRLTYYEKGSLYSCIKFYNSIPSELKSIENIQSFKARLYSYLCEVEPYSVAEFLSHR